MLPTEPTHEVRLIGAALEAVTKLNIQVVDALVRSALAKSPGFPLPSHVREPLANLSASERVNLAASGVLLADSESLNRDLRSLDAATTDRAPVEVIEWLSTEDALVLTYSVLTVTWYVIHCVPSAAGVLLGLSESVLGEFRRLGVGQLARVARRCSGRLRPRWTDRPDVWADLIVRSSEPEEMSGSTVALRCLTVSAASGPMVLASMEVDRPR